MNQSSNTIRTLETRVKALELEYARLNERLRTVGAALGGAEAPPAREATPPEPRMPVPKTVSQSGKRPESASRTALQRGRPQTAASAPAAAKQTAKKAAPSPSAKKTMQGAQANGPRKWFEKGEALALFRGILKRPMPTRDLMTRVVAAKRKAQLPKEDLERFKWAVHSALKEAISANVIVRQNDGMIALTPTNVRVAAKVAGKAKK